MLAVYRGQLIHRHCRTTREHLTYSSRQVEMHIKTTRCRQLTRQWSSIEALRWSIETGPEAKKMFAGDDSESVGAGTTHSGERKHG